LNDVEGDSGEPGRIDIEINLYKNLMCSKSLLNKLSKLVRETAGREQRSVPFEGVTGEWRGGWETYEVT
jgi:hypothetical protein